MDVLGVLVRKPRAFIVPVESPAFYPGDPLYERLVAPFRCASVDVWTLDAPLGIVSENNVVRHPEFRRLMLPMTERQAEAEAEVRIRAWLSQYGLAYDKIILLGFGEFMPAFSKPMYGISLPIKVVPVRRRGGGLMSTILRDQLDRAMGLS